jgi:hypothetical protein
MGGGALGHGDPCNWVPPHHPSQMVLVEVPHVQFVDLLKQVIKVNMQIVPKQTEIMVPLFVECHVGVVSLTVKEELVENVI